LNPNTLTVTITDDMPELVSGGHSTGSVDEGALTAATDSYGTGNDPLASVTTGGLLTDVVHFGADGPAAGGGYQFTITNGQAILAGVTSHGLGLTGTFVGNVLT